MQTQIFQNHLTSLQTKYNKMSQCFRRPVSVWRYSCASMCANVLISKYNSGTIYRKWQTTLGGVIKQMFSERYSTLVCVCVCVCSCSCSAEGYNCDKFLIALELIPKRAQDARVCNYSSEPGFWEAHKENRHKTITSMFIKMYALHYNSIWILIIIQSSLSVSEMKLLANV